MQILKMVRVSSCLLFAITMVFVRPAFAQNHFPLEVTNIKPVGSIPSGLDADSRIYRAYTGFTYNIRPAVIGGNYPYTFSLSNAPSGMAINANTGEITWSNPQANATPTLTVRDASGAQVNSSWTITVGTSRFKFIDAVNGRNASNNGCSSSCGTGSQASPWRTIKDMYLNAAADDITYFRAGTYGVLDIARAGVGGPWEAVTLNESRSVIWLAYPGESPRIDFGWTGGGEWGPMIYMEGTTIYVDGFETVNSHIMAFQVGGTSTGATFRKNLLHHHGPGTAGTNASFIMTTQQYPNVAYGMVIQDNVFYDSPVDVNIKLYSQNKTLIENNVFHDTVAAMELKSDVRQFTVRGNTFYNITTNIWDALAIGGNMHGLNDQPTTGGEICYNNVRSTDNLAISLNQDGQAMPIYVYRNTFVGHVAVTNTDAADGPFTFRNNVIINNDGGNRIQLIGVTAPERVIVTNNLAGAPSQAIVDSLGNLTAAYAQYLGTMGYQLGSGGSTPPPSPAPSAPTNVRIIR